MQEGKEEEEEEGEGVEVSPAAGGEDSASEGVSLSDSTCVIADWDTGVGPYDRCR